MTSRPRVLIVDDDPAVVLTLVRALYKDNERYDVLMASTGEIAQQIMREISVRVLVTDIGLPGLSGMDLIYWVASEHPNTHVAVITAQDLSQLKEKAYRQGVLHIVKKPVHVEQMRSLVQSLLSDQGLSGDLSMLSVVDVIQMLCLGKKTTGLQLVQDAISGLVVIEMGNIIHAQWGEKQGTAALFALMRARQGIFQTVQFSSPTLRTIDDDWQRLLNEAARLEEEERVAAGIVRQGVPADLLKSSVGSTPAFFRSQGTPKPSLESSRATKITDLERAEVEKLVQKGFEQLRRADYPGARSTWLEAGRMDPQNQLVKMNLKKLERLASKA